ncbi:MAG: GGDEF domain-containing phosphodiesterase, partial [Oscillospiraceae bacterium]
MEAQNQILHCFLTEDFYAEVEKKLKMVSPNEYAIVSIDFDNFKYVNELFGYEFGDMVLNSVTEHFSRYLQDDEIFTRINADNFVFFIKTSINQSVIEYFLNMVNYQMSMLSILPKHYTVVTSGGICTIKNPNETISSLIDKANFARKLAKGKHTSNFLYYTDEMADELSWKKEITLSMESALENNEFEMYLQPKILMKNNSVIGAEALVRWNSKKNGLIYPDRFIPVLEQNGFIKQIDFFMLEQVCKFLRKCIVDDMPVLPISVNFSKVHMATENLPEKIFEVVSNNHVFPEFIEIELTESVFANDYHQLIDIATRLKSLGFKVSLDDFGSAYSSLSYLKDFPVDVIKIDKGFIDEASNTEKGRLIIEKTIDMIKSLDIVPVMEGIEDSSQAEFIKRLNCDIGQGFFYAKAMPVSEFEIFVKNNL